MGGFQGYEQTLGKRVHFWFFAVCFCALFRFKPQPANPQTHQSLSSHPCSRFDPDGHYVRRWLPVLAQLPAEYIHTPWRAPEEALEAAGAPRPPPCLFLLSFLVLCRAFPPASSISLPHSTHTHKQPTKPPP